jgi:RimJ/RimL family protein N-acetyltransferase
VPAIEPPDRPLADEAVLLRAWRRSDVAAAHRATLDPLIPRFTRVPEANTERNVRAYLLEQEPRRRAGEEIAFAIADARDEQLLGAIALGRFSWPDARAEIGYWLAPWARGRGIASRAVRLLARWALVDVGLARLELRTDAENAASQRVAERCGFVREGTLRSHEDLKGRRRDVIVFSLLPGEVDRLG